MWHGGFSVAPSSVRLQLQGEVWLSGFTMVTELVERIGDAGLVSMETDSELKILLLMDDSLELALGREEGRARKVE